MKYARLSIELLNKYKYPNLIAELIESGYSICTVGDHLGMGAYRKEDDKEVWDKLKGDTEIFASEALALSKLFDTKMEYLFSKNLEVIDEKPIAYYRWFDDNREKEKELKRIEDIQTIEKALEEKPYLLKFFMISLDCSSNQIGKVIKMLRSVKEVM